MDLRKTALLVIDMQNDFAAEGGMFQRAGIDISVVRRAIGPIQSVVEAARRAGTRIIYLKMGFRSDLSDLGEEGSPNRVRHLRFGVGQASVSVDGRPGRFLIRDTWNTDVIQELQPHSKDTVIYKHRFSGFFETELDQTLRSDGIENLIVTGCTTGVCVDSTIRDAMFRDYKCLLLADCAGEPIGSQLERSNHDATVLMIEVLFGWVSNSSEFITAIGACMEAGTATRA